MTMKHNNNGLSNHNGSFHYYLTNSTVDIERHGEFYRTVPTRTRPKKKKKESLNDGGTTKK